MTTLTSDRVENLARTYEERDPFVTVETERLETMPEAFSTGAFVWKDAEWVVRWYARRFVDGNSSAIESPFSRNSFDDIESAIQGACTADDIESKVQTLCSLDGVDLEIATAFLQYIDPERYIVMSDQLWEKLNEADRLSAPYSQPPTIDAYRSYLEACRSLGTDADVSLVTVYRALALRES